MGKIEEERIRFLKNRSSPQTLRTRNLQVVWSFFFLSYLCINQTSFSPNGGKLDRQHSCPSHFSSLVYQRSIASVSVLGKITGRVAIGILWISHLFLKPTTVVRELIYCGWKTYLEPIGWFYPKEGRVNLSISKNVSQTKQ